MGLGNEPYGLRPIMGCVVVLNVPSMCASRVSHSRRGRERGRERERERESESEGEGEREREREREREMGCRVSGPSPDEHSSGSIFKNHAVKEDTGSWSQPMLE